jgi:transcriptional regulator GlxA family with amidase domain
MHTVAILAFDGVIAFDVTTALEVFGSVVSDDGEPSYRVLVCGPKARVTAGQLGLLVPHRLDALADANTVIVPGLKDVDAHVHPSVICAVQDAHRRGARIASICVGALTLADAGLLDGLRATTHWQATEALHKRAPLTTVDPNVLYVDEGMILTSAGAAAGIDLCLHMIRSDLGATVASDAARRSVVPLTREGGQAQYIRPKLNAAKDDSLGSLLSTAAGRISEPWTVDTLAREARLTTRTLNRKFHRELAITPMQWINAERVRQAQMLLEVSDSPVETIATRLGFGSAMAFRTYFRRITQTTPGRYRAAFR